MSAEYTRKKEEAAEAKKVKRLTAKQAQRNKDNEMWEKNRMFRSGAVTRYVCRTRLPDGKKFCTTMCRDQLKSWYVVW